MTFLLLELEARGEEGLEARGDEREEENSPGKDSDRCHKQNIGMAGALENAVTATSKVVL
jgi:hypothetical protein